MIDNITKISNLYRINSILFLNRINSILFLTLSYYFQKYRQQTNLVRLNLTLDTHKSHYIIFEIVNKKSWISKYNKKDSLVQKKLKHNVMTSNVCSPVKMDMQEMINSINVEMKIGNRYIMIFGVQKVIFTVNIRY